MEIIRNSKKECLDEEVTLYASIRYHSSRRSKTVILLQFKSLPSNFCEMQRRGTRPSGKRLFRRFRVLKYATIA